jgi:hypothetical protein
MSWEEEKDHFTSDSTPQGAPVANRLADELCQLC